jgi:hypothetical protein
LTTYHGIHYAFQIAEVHAIHGDVESVFEWLDRAYAQRDFGLCELQGNASFRPFHGDPRWNAMLAKLGFESASS